MTDYVDDRYILALSRSLALNGQPVPGRSLLMVLSPTEHADNLEGHQKASGTWTCPPDWHCLRCDVKTQDKCQRTKTGTTLPARGKPIGDIVLEPVMVSPPLEDDETLLHLYVSKPRAVGRPKKYASEGERADALATKRRSFQRTKWTLAKLQALTRSDLYVLAPIVGVTNPASRGTNEKLRRAIARKLGLM